MPLMLSVADMSLAGPLPSVPLHAQAVCDDESDVEVLPSELRLRAKRTIQLMRHLIL